MLKLGFIGGSINSIAGYPHFIASQMDCRFKVVAGAFSTNTIINQDTAKKWHIERLYNSWKELIVAEKDKLDAIVVLVPTPLHADVIIELLKNDIPVISEKTMVSSIEEVKDLEKYYQPNRHFLRITNNYSGYPMVRILRQKLIQNELGNILQIRIQMPQESFLRPPKSIKYPQKWRLQDNFIPIISLDLGVHCHHLAYFLLGQDPTEIRAEYNKFSKYNVVDDIMMSLKYSDGKSGIFWISKTALGYRNGLKIEVLGEKAGATWIQENPEKLELAFSNGEKFILDRGSDVPIDNRLYNRMTPGHPAGFIEAFANLYNDIADDLSVFKQGYKKNNSFVFGFEHAKQGIKLLHGASESNNKRNWQLL